jgi:uncharacterized protein (TIGR02687 family)
MTSLHHRLQTLFDHPDPRHRIVLWYGNDDPEMASAFEAVDLPEVEKIRVERNAFATKVRVLCEEPKQRFLLFRPGAVPPPRENWLLDLQLAHPVFSTDEVAIYREELNIDRTADEVIRTHLSFFASRQRRDALVGYLPDDRRSNGAELERGMVAAILRAESGEATEIGLALLAVGKSDRSKVEAALAKHGLDDVLWTLLRRHYDYRSEAPSIDDFTKALFATRLSQFIEGEHPRSNRESLLLLARWKDSNRYRKVFREVATDLGSQWRIDERLMDTEVGRIATVDEFQEIDHYLIGYLRDAYMGSTLPNAEIRKLVEARRQTFWYADFADTYQALLQALDFRDSQESLHLRSAAQDSIGAYTKAQYRTDLAYRRFHYHARRIQRHRLLDPIAEYVERYYVNTYLPQVHWSWQERLDERGYLSVAADYERQRDFWQKRVKEYPERGNRIFVIISDGLRYESGVELAERLNATSRFEATVRPLLAAAPTYTQVGMAALLPHDELAIQADGSVTADGQSTQGTANRDKILKAATNGRAIAIRAEDFRNQYSGRDAGRSWVKQYDVVYIYLNLIDKAGENEEEQLFARTEDSFGEVEELLRIIARMNGNNVFITADHGYLYQHSEVADSDFITYDVAGEMEKNNRRFVLGQSLRAPDAAMHFTARELGLKGDREVVLPKSVKRFRQRGSGSRYVHGGLSLQEVVIPLIQFTKKRTASDDTRPVDVVLTTTSHQITNTLKTLHFYQQQAVGGKRVARELQLVFQNAAGENVSDLHRLTFDSTEREERQRDKSVTFQFSAAATQSDDKRVYLKMLEPGGAKYDDHMFTVRISFTNDFDTSDL